MIFKFNYSMFLKGLSCVIFTITCRLDYFTPRCAEGTAEVWSSYLWDHNFVLGDGGALLNPFDTEHREKTAVKFSILRVVMLWSS